MLLLTSVLFHERILSASAHWLDVGELPRHNDYVMVLMGSEETRPFVAAELFKAGLAQHFLVAKLRNLETQKTAIAADADDVVATILESQGVPASRIHRIGGPVHSTRDEIVALGDFMKEHPNATYAVVTNDFHTRRTRWTIRQLLESDQVARVQMISAPTDDYSPDNWWKHDAGFSIYIREFSKFAIYSCRDGLGLLFAGVCVVVFGLVVRYVW